MATIELNRTLNITISNGTKTYVNGTNFGISMGTANLEEILCSSDFKLGEFCSNKFEVEIFDNKDSGLPNVTGYNIEVSYTIPSGTLPLFSGIIDESNTDNGNYERQLVAYDVGYSIKDKDVASIWTEFWNSNQTKTIKNLRNYLVTNVGLTSVTKTLTNDDLVITKPNDFTSVTFGELITMICELQSCVPHINRSGVLDFIQLNKTVKATLNSNNYEYGSVEFADYTTQDTTGINVFSTSDDLVQNYPENSGINAYPIAGNIFLLNMTSTELNTTLQPIFSAIQNITYKPCKMPMIVSDLTYQLGDYIKSDKGYHYILSQTFSGSLLVEQEIECSAYGEIRDQKASSINNTSIVGRKMSKVEQTIDGITTQVEEVATTASEAKTTASEAKQTADGISTTVQTVVTQVGDLSEDVIQNSSSISNINQTSSELQISVSTTNGKLNDVSDQLETIQTAVMVKSDGVYVLDRSVSSLEEIANLSYTKIISKGVDIYSEGDRVAYFRDKGTYSKDFITNGWHMQTANNNNSFNFIRKEYTNLDDE